MNVSEPEMTSVTDLTDDELAQKWNETEWAEVETIVNNLQVRIASAAKNKEICSKLTPERVEVARAGWSESFTSSSEKTGRGRE